MQSRDEAGEDPEQGRGGRLLTGAGALENVNNL